MNKQPIGILDSGVGGLSIWKEINRLLPHEATVYIADSKNCPYGNKSSESIYQLAKRLVQFLLAKDVKLIVLACNTITVSCLDKLRSEFSNVPIIGTVPVIKTATEVSKTGQIGILSTERTAKSVYQRDLIARFASNCEVINIGTNNLVPFIERGEFDNPKLHQALVLDLQPFKKARVDTIALGCSHFPFIKEQIQQILGSSVLILDSGQAIARQVKRVLEANNLLSQNIHAAHALYTTGKEGEFIKTVKQLIGYNRQYVVKVCNYE